LAQLDFVQRTEHGQVAFVLEGQFDGGDLLGIAMGKVGDLAFADAGADAVGLAEVDGGIDCAVGGAPGGAGDVHVDIIINESKHNLREKTELWVSTLSRPKTNLSPNPRNGYLKNSEMNIRWKANVGRGMTSSARRAAKRKPGLRHRSRRIAQPGSS
jgi:hypothetical protein